MAAENSSNSAPNQPSIVELADKHLFGDFDRPDLTLNWDGKRTSRWWKHIELMDTILYRLDTDPDYEVLIRNSAGRKAYMRKALEKQANGEEVESEENSEHEESSEEEGSTDGEAEAETSAGGEGKKPEESSGNAEVSKKEDSKEE